MQEKRASYSQAYLYKYATKTENTTTTTTTATIELDNTPDEWAKEAVEWAKKNKILFGDDKGNYKLHNNCTRQEMLIFLYRLYNLIK
jgi:hypothetical protein